MHHFSPTEEKPSNLIQSVSLGHANRQVSPVFPGGIAVSGHMPCSAVLWWLTRGRCGKLALHSGDLLHNTCLKTLAVLDAVLLINVSSFFRTRMQVLLTRLRYESTLTSDMLPLLPPPFPNWFFPVFHYGRRLSLSISTGADPAGRLGRGATGRAPT